MKHSSRIDSKNAQKALDDIAHHVRKIKWLTKVHLNKQAQLEDNIRNENNKKIVDAISIPDSNTTK